MPEKKKKVITILIKICGLVILRNGEWAGNEILMSSLTNTRCQEMLPKMDQVKNNNVLLRSMWVLLGIHTEETRRERDTCTPMFIAALFRSEEL